MNELISQLEMEISHQSSNDWVNDKALQYYIKGIQYAIALITEKIRNLKEDE
jgi:hypothetical protein